jgi:hypothetical protein
MATRLSILTYLQERDGNALQARVLMIPRGSPLDPLTAGAPSFAEADFVFSARVVPGLDNLPTSAAPATETLNLGKLPTSKPLFEALQTVYQIDPAPPPASPRRANTFFKKHLPLTYQAAAKSTGERSPYVFTDDTYSCALSTPPRKPFVSFPPFNPKVPWGKVIAFIMRNPQLAEQAGLIRSISVPIAAPTDLLEGGWLYVTLDSTSDGAGLLGIPDGLKVYAARIPALSDPRPLFTPVLFPVATAPSGVSYDDLFAEVDDYNDGFAKAVHTVQSKQLDPLQEHPDGTRPAKDLGVRIGWDDEQVTIWLNRQIDPTAADLDAPMGVFGYRVDVREHTETNWHSLSQATGPLRVGAYDGGTFTGELGVETHPVQLDGDKTGDFWLPTYFTAWTGPSLVGLDADQIRIVNGPDKRDAGRVQAIQPDIALKYGTTYDFRVRFMDHTGGGPAIGDHLAVPGPSPVSSIPVRRWIRPGLVEITDKIPATPDPANPVLNLHFLRPRLSYPAVALTNAYVDPVTLLLSDLPSAQAEEREPGLRDPDVTSVKFVIEAQGLAQDPNADAGSFVTLYETTRDFPAEFGSALDVDLEYVDVNDAATLDAPAGALRIPTARTVRIRYSAVCRADPHHDYFGADDVRIGKDRMVEVRKESGDERGLFAPDEPSHQFSAVFLQTDQPSETVVLAAQLFAGRGLERPADAPTRLAAHFEWRNDRLAMRAQPGRRVVFGASGALRHVTGPDGASIAFASQSDITQHWLVVVRLTLDRDWTWDGLEYNGIVVERDGVEVGRIGLTNSIGSDALIAPQRTQTDLVFIDAVDPKPAPGEFPRELNLDYTVRALLRNGGALQDPPLDLPIRLPITTPPSQKPKIVGAGIALSSYDRSPDYHSSEPRKRALWIEFDRPPADPNDAYFARVLRNVPDPLLSREEFGVPEAGEPPLPVDPEWIRSVVHGQSDDKAGLSAMQLLSPSDSPLHYLLPLPAGVDENSAELFGFYTYEIRCGHLEGWSTAQGRFGAPLRVTGVQHPAPELACAVGRTQAGVTVSAQFASAAWDGRNLQAIPPRTSMWVLLYAQAEQVDSTDFRNVLLARKPARWNRNGGNDFGGSSIGAPSQSGTATFSDAEIRSALRALTFRNDAPISVVAIELLPETEERPDPVGADLGSQRILRTSPLTPVPAIC